jgi:hypothetical protein
VGTILAAVVAVVGLAVLGLFLWLRTYTPLRAIRPIQPGAGLGADVEPTYGSGGKTVFIPVYRRGRAFVVTFTLENTGRFAVTVLGTDPGPARALTPGPLVVGPAAFTGDLRLNPHDSAEVSVGWRLDCSHTKSEVTTDRLRIRYRYLSMFNRTQAVELPFAVTLRCSGGPPASP